MAEPAAIESMCGMPKSIKKNLDRYALDKEYSMSPPTADDTFFAIQVPWRQHRSKHCVEEQPILTAPKETKTFPSSASEGIGMLSFARILANGSSKLRCNTVTVRSLRLSLIMAEEELEAIKKNPYFDKYADKIAKLQQTSPEEFRSRLEASAKKKEQEKSTEEQGKQFSTAGIPKPSLKDFQTKEKKLDDVMKMDLIKDKSAEEVTKIWTKYYKGKDCTCAVVPAATYKKIKERSEKFNTFILPLPRKEGYEFILLQFSKNECHFTPLIAYQTHQANAPECLSMVFYTELIHDKKIVLMHGEFDKNVMDAKDAAFLGNQLQLYYGQDNRSRMNLLETFTTRSSEFQPMLLIDQIENINLING